jgi:hypothetical protein
MLLDGSFTILVDSQQGKEIFIVCKVFMLPLSLGVFTKLQNVAIKLVMSVHSSTWNYLALRAQIFMKCFKEELWRISEYMFCSVCGIVVESDMPQMTV